MKKFFLPIFAVLLVLGSILPLAAYRVTRAVLSGAEPASSAVSSPAASAQPPSAVPSADAETFLVEDQATGQVLELSRQEYVLGAVAAEMPVSWPDEALKAQRCATAMRSTAETTPPCKAALGSLPTQPGGRAA